MAEGDAMEGSTSQSIVKSKGNQNNADTVPYYKLYSFADSKDILLMIIGTFGGVFNGLSIPVISIILGDLIDAFGHNANTKNTLKAVSKVAPRFIYLGAGTAIASFLQVACWMVTGERQAARVRSLYLKTILKQDVAFFDKEITGEVVGRMAGDTVVIQAAMGEKVGAFIQLLATFIGSFVIALIRGWLLALVMLACIPPLVISGALMSIAVTKMASRAQAANTQAGAVVGQTLCSIRTVVSFTGENHAITQYEKSLSKAYVCGVQEGLASGLGVGVALLSIFVTYALGIWFGGKMIIENGYTGGDVLSVIFAVLTGSMSLGVASPYLSAFAAGKSAAFKMFETISRKSDIDSSDTKGNILDGIHGDIELRDVCFCYPTRPDEQIFNGFSLSIPSGSTSALVGQSGSGKSTVISLIERFYDPQAGEVLIDGINLKDFQLRWIREKIGLVSQEPVLFASSIKDNIAYGKDGATIEEIKAAALIANAAVFIDELPLGLDTLVGEHGTQLSGGQKQRVAIARAILKDPRILLLDEATSALDAESEQIVQEALDRIMVNRTTVIIAHRLSTIRNADIIAVLHQGKIVEKGSHSELLKDPDGAYSQLIRLQEVNISENYTTENVESQRTSSTCQSFEQSVSLGLSGVGKSSRHSFSAPSGPHAGFTEKNESVDLKSTPLSRGQTEEVPLLHLAYLNKPEIPVLLLGLVAAVVTGVIFPIFGTLLSIVTKSFFLPEDELRKDTRYWAIVYIAAGVVSLAAQSATTYFFSVAGCRLIQRIRNMCFKKIVHMEISWFDVPQNSSGSIGARLSVDAASVRSLVGDALARLVQTTASAVAALVLAFIANWTLALIILALIPLIGFSGYVQKGFTKGFTANSKVMYEEASQVANDAIGSIRTIASFGAEEKVMQLYQRKSEGPVRTGIRRGWISGFAFGFSFLWLSCMYATAFYAGARLVDDGKTTFDKVLQVFFSLSLAAFGISSSQAGAPDSSKSRTATTSIFHILEQKSKIDSSDEIGLTIENFNGDIELHHISFKYPARPDIQILKDLSLGIRSGKTVALVGESGSGKSTVVALLQRFYDPDSGHITLDGIDIEKLQLKWLRQQMGVVSQEPALFNDTIRANIAYGMEGDATETEILAAAELANAHKFISGLKQGFDTVVGEKGIQLSGGQKQRVAIARAMVKAPKILLLDEATSALDAESERVVQDALDKVTVNRTSIVVAHRLSTIINADVIAVVKNGVIIEKGSHSSLINIENGNYASLVALHSRAL